jgi:hypothetical protein
VPKILNIKPVNMLLKHDKPKTKPVAGMRVYALMTIFE